MSPEELHARKAAANILLDPLMGVIRQKVELALLVVVDSVHEQVEARVMAERERCAKEADAAADRVFDEEAIGACRYIAAAIRKEPA